MGSKVSIIVVVLCLGIMASNHYLVPWEHIAVQRAEKYFGRLIQEQQDDLLTWEDFAVGNAKFSKRRICNGEVQSWSGNGAWIVGRQEEDVYVTAQETGIFLVQRVLGDGSCEKVSIYPLTLTYAITNQYLRSGANLSLPRDVVNISLNTGKYSYARLFYYDVEGSPSKALDMALGVVVLLLSLVWVWRGLCSRFLPAIFVVFVVRLGMLFYNVLSGIFRYPLFSPLYYTSSFWTPSLGDLFLNSLLVFLICLAWSRRFRKQEEVYAGRMVYLWLFVSLLLSVSVFWIIQSILDHSQIVMDVGKSIAFDLLRIIACLCILLVIGSQFLFTFRSIMLIKASTKSVHYVGFLAIISIILFFFSPSNGAVGIFFTLFVISMSQLGWAHRLKEFKYQTLQFVLVVSILMGVGLSLSVYKFHEISELDTKRKFANYLLIKRDVIGEYHLNEMVKKARIAGLKNLPLEEGQSFILDQLLSPYFDKYTMEMLHKSRDSREYSAWLGQLTAHHLSDYDDIYFMDRGASFHYLAVIDPFLVKLSLKKRMLSSVYPALLTDYKHFTLSANFDYAIFQDHKILFHRSQFGQGEWPDIQNFENSRLYDKGIKKNERHYYGVKTSDGRIILIISKKYSYRMLLANFSFFFLIQLFFIGAIVLLSSLNLSRLRLSFTSKIQLYLGLAFIFPLFTAGFALLNSLNRSYKDEINRSYLKKSLHLSEVLSYMMVTSPEDITSARLVEIRNLMQADVSVYDVSGYLTATSQSEIFDFKLQGRLINPTVYHELIAKEHQSIIVHESIGGLEYKVSYATLNDSEDRAKGFIAMPFFDSKNHLKRQQLEVLGYLLSIFAMLFITAILFGNMVLNNLLHPLRLVAGKIREITLQKENKPITYKSSDEIGSLVRDYNSMLVKLEASKAALARSQKEMAWKGIAKQVAHEIKNPLTPMQLKIQQLLRKQDRGSKDYQTLSALLTQVHALDQIASSFSAFAELPAPENKNFDLSSTLNQVISLYEVDNVKIDKNIEQEIWIYGDKDIFQRIINNIVLNAIQSVDGKEAHLRVTLRKKGQKCELSVNDNGRGISEEAKDKIFLHYFSTKSKGSGVGLALAKKGIEHVGGSIWVESKKEEGSTFYVSLPLASA